MPPKGIFKVRIPHTGQIIEGTIPELLEATQAFRFRIQPARTSKAGIILPDTELVQQSLIADFNDPSRRPLIFSNPKTRDIVRRMDQIADGKSTIITAKTPTSPTAGDLLSEGTTTLLPIFSSFGATPSPESVAQSAIDLHLVPADQQVISPMMITGYKGMNPSRGGYEGDWIDIPALSDNFTSDKFGSPFMSTNDLTGFYYSDYGKSSKEPLFRQYFGDLFGPLNKKSEQAANHFLDVIHALGTKYSGSSTGRVVWDGAPVKQKSFGTIPEPLADPKDATEIQDALDYHYSINRLDTMFGAYNPAGIARVITPFSNARAFIGPSTLATWNANFSPADFFKFDPQTRTMKQAQWNATGRVNMDKIAQTLNDRLSMVILPNASDGGGAIGANIILPRTGTEIVKKNGGRLPTFKRI